jgi:hypothetical protein
MHKIIGFFLALFFLNSTAVLGNSSDTSSHVAPAHETAEQDERAEMSEYVKKTLWFPITCNYLGWWFAHVHVI